MSKPKILIVERESSADELRQQLFALGYEPSGVVTQGEQALKIAQTQPPALVLMSASLDSLFGGVAVSSLINTRCAVPVVLLAEPGGDAPPDALRRPFSLRELRLVIEMALYKSQAEEKLREQAAALQELAQEREFLAFSFQQAAVPTFWVGRGARILRVNRAATELHGYSEEELLTKSITELDPNFPVERWPLHWEELRAQRRLRFETFNKHRDGWLIPVEVDLCWFEFGGVEYNLGFVRDITARKRAEEALRANEENLESLVSERTSALRKSEQQLSYALEATSDGLWDWSVATGHVHYSPQWARLLGYAPEEVPSRVEFFLERLHPEDVERTNQAINEHLAGLSPIKQNEIRLRVKSGEYRWFLDRGKAVEWGSDGKALRMVGTITDITARKEDEEKMARSVALLRATLESTADGIMAIRQDRQVESYNRRFAEMWKLHPEALNFKGGPVLPSVIDKLSSPERYLERVEYLYNHPHEESFDLLDFKDGRVFEIYSRPMLVDEQPRGRVWSYRDITQRKRAEESLRRSEEELAATLRSIGDAVFATDANGLITHLNPTASLLTKDPTSNVIGQPLAEVCSQIRPEALSALLTTGETQSCEATLAEDGRQRWFLSHLNPIRRNDKISGAVVVCRDVTDKKRTEAQLIASDRMASVGILAAGVAHEINNPLTAVITNLELALSGLDSVDSPGVLEELQSGLGDALECSGRIRSIVRDLKIFSRSEEDSSGSTDAIRVLESSLRMVSAEIRHRARLVREYQEIPLVRADDARLGQAFVNIIVNAAHAIPEGRSEDNEIRVSARLDKRGEVVIKISDTGVGMSEETRRRLFTPFFTTKPVGIGTGLGLAICQRIISDLNGRIECESELGRGTSFFIYLPRADSPQKIVEAPPLVPPKRRGKILIIDDEVSVVNVISRVLSGEHDTTAINNSQEALSTILSGGSFDVILCDLMMPGMNGMELYAAIAAQAPELVSKIIFITGGAFTAGAQAFLSSVPNECIEKPFRQERLRSLINERVT